VGMCVYAMIGYAVVSVDVFDELMLEYFVDN